MKLRSFATKLLYGSGSLFELARGVILAVLIGIFLHYFVFSVYPVIGDSMQNSLSPGDLVFVNKITKWNQLSRGQIAIVRFPADEKGKLYVKRIVGIPGDEIAVIKNALYLDGQKISEDYVDPVYFELETTLNSGPISLGENEYFILGDNRSNSTDSRTFGTIKKQDIIGKGQAIIWPLNQAKTLILPEYK